MTYTSSSIAGVVRGLGLLATLLLVPAPSGCGHGCTVKACDEGLTITLDNSFDGRTLELVVSELTATPEMVPILRCQLRARTVGQGHDAFCSSPRPHREDRGITLTESFPARVVVAISDGGTNLGQQTFTPVYTNDEINGPGCGRCHFGAITVSMSGLTK